MIEYPTIKLELNGFKQTMMSSFHNYQSDIESYVEKKINDLIKSDSLKFEIDQAIEDSLNKAVINSIDKYFKYGQGMKDIESCVNTFFSGMSGK